MTEKDIKLMLSMVCKEVVSDVSQKIEDMKDDIKRGQNESNATCALFQRENVARLMKHQEDISTRLIEHQAQSKGELAWIINTKNNQQTDMIMRQLTRADDEADETYDWDDWAYMSACQSGLDSDNLGGSDMYSWKEDYT